MRFLSSLRGFRKAWPPAYEKHCTCCFSFEFKIQKGLIRSYCDLKLIHSEKATKFCKSSTVDFFPVVQVKSLVEISQNCVAFSEYLNFRGRKSAIRYNKVFGPIAQYLTWKGQQQSALAGIG